MCQAQIFQPCNQTQSRCSRKPPENSEFIETYSLAPRTCCVLLKNASQDFWSVICSAMEPFEPRFPPNIFHPDMVCSFENLKKKTKKNKTDFKGLRSEDEFFYSEVVKMDFVSFNTFIAPHWSWTVLRASIWARTIINTVHMRVKPNPMLCFLLQRLVSWSFTHSLTVSVGSLRPLARLLDSLALTRLHCLGEAEGRARDLLMLLQLLGCW